MGLAEIRPLALVVEDKEELREMRVEILEQAGFYVIGASSRRDAEREIRACPSIDILVTDVNLNEALSTEKSGIELAGSLRQLRPNLPIIGYSAKFEGLPDAEDAVFDQVFLKGSSTPEKLRQQANQLYDKAQQYRKDRDQGAADDARRLQELYKIDAYDFNLLREFTPGLAPAESGISKSIDAVLREAGYKLEIIEKETVPDEAASEGLIVERPIAVWLRLGSDYVIAEVYRFPNLYASGSSEKEAITQLLLLMAGYHEDLSTVVNIDKGLRDLQEYLHHVFGKNHATDHGGSQKTNP